MLLDLRSRDETCVNGKRVDNQVLINDDVIPSAITEPGSSIDKSAARRLLKAAGD